MKNTTLLRWITGGMGLVVWLGAGIARADFSVGVDAGPEFAFRDSVLAGGAAALTMGGEWDERHRLAGKVLVLFADPLEHPRLVSTGYGGALMIAYRFRPGWEVEPFFEVSTGVGLMGGDLQVGNIPTPIGAVFMGAGGLRVGLGESFAFYAQAQARGWVAWQSAMLWGLSAGLEI